ncbi:MAG: class I SAM-dependent methyltransferase [Thermosynechococcaceae cyanobacterium]
MVKELTINRIQHIQDVHWSKDKRTRRQPNHPVVQAVFGPLADIVAASVENPQTASVLDVGCGNGFLQWALEQRFGVVEGLDYSAQMLAINPCQVKHQGTCTSLPFADQSFDLVVASNLLHHLPPKNRTQALAEMCWVTRSKIISFEPNRNNPFVFALSLFIPEERMVLAFSRSYMHQLFADAGCSNISTQVESWMIPNTLPAAWIPMGDEIASTPLKRWGFDICTIGQVHD